MTLCARDDPVFNECVRDNLQFLLTEFRSGAREFDLEPLDPLFIPEMVINYKQGQITTTVVASNITNYVYNERLVRAVRSDLNATNYFMEIDLEYPRIYVEGLYKADGKIFGFLMEDQGNFSVNLTDVFVTWRLIGETVTRDGEEYMEIKNFTMKPKIKTLKFSATGIFKNANLNRGAVAFINSIWRAFYRDMLPYVSTTWDKTMTPIANKVFLKVPYEQLFPVNPANVSSSED